MDRELRVDGRTLRYELTRKNVKNINLRVHSDGSIAVSAPRLTSAGRIDEFVLSQGGRIFKALDKYAAKKSALPPKGDETLLRKLCEERILTMCSQAYPFFAPYGVDCPQIKFRKMKSRWGSCNSTRGILTFNTALASVPEECAEYVVYHEFTHFLHPDHSPAFYAALARFIPDWKARRKRLSQWTLR